MSLLAQALTNIRPMTVRYFANTGRTTNSAGKYVSAFAPGADVATGHVQPVPVSRYSSLGLDFAKRYVTWFAPVEAFGTRRDFGGDEFEWNGRRYSVAGETSWTVQDGWGIFTGQDVGAAHA
jgi:hypothetical protein